MSEINEWTVMFFFGSDNPLSPLIVSQIKAIKDAGFQEHTDVLVHFDSNQKGALTRLYEVNRKRKKDQDLPKTMIGDGNDPYVRNMVEDNIKPAEINTDAGTASAAMSRALQRPDTVNAKDALTNFIGFCRENHRAKHYLLFLIGHGLVVGNDTFLPDDSPESGITLIELGAILGDFSEQVKNHGTFEMLALHSCSMSAIEVAYQLKGTANYMMASEGPSYLGAWPYRQLLKKLFNTVEKAKPEARESASYVPTLMSKLYYLTLFNATDFMLSGYSLDHALCNLSKDKFNGFKEKFQNLVRVLKESLYDKRGKELIQLAHLESQSYWQEDYTDLFDFCQCLRRKCTEDNGLQKAIKDACDGVIGKQETTDTSSPFSALVVHSENFGSKYQYSHGLSIYFPWCEPTADEPSPSSGARAQDASPQDTQEETHNSIMSNYQKYAFNTEFEKDLSWYSFLKAYFEETQRDSRAEEDGWSGFTTDNFVPIVFDPFGALGPGDKETGAYSKETGGYGSGCTCPSIKNYPTGTAKINGKEQQVRAVSVSEGLIDAFK